MLVLDFARLHTDPAGLSGRDLGGSLVAQVSSIFADFVLRGSRGAEYVDESFPIIEFAHQVSGWLRTSAVGEEFVYDSMFFELPGHIVLSPAERGWAVTADCREIDLGVHGHVEVEGVLHDFVGRVVDACGETWGMRLSFGPDGQG